MKAVVGAVQQANRVVLVTVRGREVLDRRTVALTTDLPTHPHHHEGSFALGRYANAAVHAGSAQGITLPEVVALVERVRVAARAGADAALAGLAPLGADAIAIKACPPLPPTVEARIRDARAQTQADGVLYREALAEAAIARGWDVRWYDEDAVLAALDAIARPAGPPWRKEHRIAAAAAARWSRLE